MSRAHSRYSSVAILLHWVMAALILFMIWLGQNMEGHEARFQLHKSIGITLLVLTLARIVWRAYNKPPPLPADVSPIESTLSKLVQFGFYALMLLIPLGGWIMVSVSPFAVPTVLFETVSWPNLPLARDEQSYKLLAFLHGKGASFGFLSLLLLHVAGAVKHQLGAETGVLKRIVPGAKGEQAAPSKGALPTVLTSLGFFLAAAAIPLVNQTGYSAAQTSPAASLQPNWTVAEAGKSIAFNFSHDGSDYTGRFKNWEAQIEFYEDNLAASHVRVDIDLSSAVTGQKLYDDSLRAAEWFDVKTKPNAVVTLANFSSGDTPHSYIAEAVLDFKGLQVTVPFTFVLKIDGDQAALTGSTSFSRQGLNIGQDSDPGADWVSEDIGVEVSLRARRTAR